MREYHIYRYTLPVEAGVILRHQRLKQREGLIVHLKCGTLEGWGEIAPLPEFSEESVDEAQTQAIEWLAAWDEARCNNQKMPLDNLYPSVAFGLSCALAELKNRINEEGNYYTAPLCYGDPDELYQQLDEMPGEKVAKIKVGLYEANRDGLIADMLLEAIPDLKLRLDANRSWSLEKAAQFARYVHPSRRPRIQFIEEPCKTVELSREFAKEHDIAIAWDETVREEGFECKAEPHLTAIVIKPTLVGSLEKCIELIEKAHAQGLIAVISSSIESSLGLTQLARIAQQYTPEVTPGLDTLDLMEGQLLRPWPGSSLPLANLESEWVKKII